MNNQEWATSRSAWKMLLGLSNTAPQSFQKHSPIIQEYFITCCWRIKHLIPQSGIREGLLGTQLWINNLIDIEELAELDYISEADAFALVYSPDKEPSASLIKSTMMVEKLSHEAAWSKLKKAAFFANAVINFSSGRKAHLYKNLNNEALCADLLYQMLPKPLRE